MQAHLPNEEETVEISNSETATSAMRASKSTLMEKIGKKEERSNKNGDITPSRESFKVSK